MPRRGNPGNREMIDAALSPSLLLALEEMRELLDIDDWQRTPLAAPFQCAAAILEGARLVGEGIAPTEAVYLAADRLGLERETVKSWATRWSAASRVHYAHAKGRVSVASLVREAHDALTPTEPRAA